MLSKDKMRVVFEALCDGEQDAALYMVYMQQFTDAILMYFWLQKNGIRGKKLIAFFEEHGRLDAVQYIRDRMAGRKFTKEKLNVEDLV